MFLKEITIDENASKIYDAIINIERRLQRYLPEYVGYYDIVSAINRSDLVILPEYLQRTITIWRSYDSISIRIRYAHKIFVNNQVYITFKVNPKNLSSGIVNGNVLSLPGIELSQSEKFNFTYNIDNDIAYGLKNILFKIGKYYEMYQRGEKPYTVVDLGLGDPITYGLYDPEIGWFSRVVKITKTDIIKIKKSMYEKYYDIFRSLHVNSRKSENEKYTEFKEILGNDNEINEMKRVVIDALADTFRNAGDFLNAPWLITDPIRIVEKEQLYKFTYGRGDTSELLKYFIEVCLRDIIAEEIINFLRSNVRYHLIKEFLLGQFSYRLLKQFGVSKIVKSREIYAMLDNENRLINIVERQQFDLLKNGFNQKMVEIVTLDKFKQINPSLEHKFI